LYHRERLTQGGRVSDPTLLLTRRDVAALLDLDACITAVEGAFAAFGAGRLGPPVVAGVPAADGGFHIKAALVPANRPYFAAKVNANFPDNPVRRALPTIQGAIMLCDGDDGRVLALLDSIEITSLRTAAATAVAARHLARRDAAVVTVCGCGVQGRVQLRALARVRRLTQVHAWDRDAARATTYADAMSRELGLAVTPAATLRAATRASDVVITCTPARRWFLGRADVGAGCFVAAVGADHEHKQEIEPDLLAGATVVVDLLEQAATLGDLHHALAAGVMTRADVHAELGAIVAGRAPGRRTDQDMIVFDSTGVAFQDVAAAAVVYERAVAARGGLRVSLAD
jgi:ornithine cyclodeaminase/alanine dehydrogenase-like protein (mu-crystallin family)